MVLYDKGNEKAKINRRLTRKEKEDIHAHIKSSYLKDTHESQEVMTKEQ